MTNSDPRFSAGSASEQFLAWLDAQIEESAAGQKRSYASAGLQNQVQGERWHARQAALYEAKMKFQSCGAESNRHSGAVGAEKRAEQSNPGGGHEVTEQNSQHETVSDKPLPDEPTPAGGRQIPGVAQRAQETRENVLKVADAIAAYFNDGPPVNGGHSDAAAGNAYELLRWAEEELRYVAAQPIERIVGLAPAAPVVSQHIGWLKQYAAGMNENNWLDMGGRIQRQLVDLSAELPPAAPVETGVIEALSAAQAALADGAFTGPMVDDALNKIAIALHGLKRVLRSSAETEELLHLADEFEAGLRKCAASGYEEYGPEWQRKRQLVIDALREKARC